MLHAAWLHVAALISASPPGTCGQAIQVRLPHRHRVGPERQRLRDVRAAHHAAVEDHLTSGSAVGEAERRMRTRPGAALGAALHERVPSYADPTRARGEAVRDGLRVRARARAGARALHARVHMHARVARLDIVADGRSDRREHIDCGRRGFQLPSSMVRHPYLRAIACEQTELSARECPHALRARAHTLVAMRGRRTH
jgi:hypothetical protein